MYYVTDAFLVFWLHPVHPVGGRHTTSVCINRSPQHLEPHQQSRLLITFISTKHHDIHCASL